MKESLKNIRNRITGYTYLLVIILCVFFMLAIMNTLELSKYANEKVDKFEIKLTEDNKNCAVFVDGNEYMFIDCNRYDNLKINGNNNDLAKGIFVSEILGKILIYIFMALALEELYMLSSMIRRGETLFQLKCRRHIKITSIMIMCSGLLIELIKIITLFSYTLKINIKNLLNPASIIITLLGVILWVLEEIISYFYSNSIANNN